MVIDVLLISDGSWLVPRTAENATFAPAERTDMPSEEVTPPSEEGFESHTTRHFPSSTMGSVSFWPRQRTTPHPMRRFSASMAQGPGQRAGAMVRSLIPCTLMAAPRRFVSVRSPGPDLLPSLFPFSRLLSLCDAPLLSQTPSDTDALRLSPAETPLPPVRLSWFWERIQTTVVVNPDDKRGKRRGLMVDSNRRMFVYSLVITLNYNLCA